ncbi:carbon storage regulator, CsrA [Succinivibrio dextrinosolvens]|uniref:carbon storage regulator n=1 Tax=Succinivibrio dextrinosolvens TaxID=83771 RepID=UPI0008E503FD|nr:carbon storage regulator [Succinivibrio dextrinosolvens]SFS40302.1 carbon storage regulator, CsrA [Succinivibrio dextrinosolvens]
MLVISQKEGDKLVLSSGITISILEVKSGKVRLGIDAPKEVEIRRVSQKENTSDKSHK